mmetsp:Transcript_53115/g.125671  ORF Transcript_53115/g.125671 Transcript_53115/m.125671 type:complete len:303 (-) Transcript_53115:82-990(-)
MLDVVGAIHPAVHRSDGRESRHFCVPEQVLGKLDLGAPPPHQRLPIHLPPIPTAQGARAIEARRWDEGLGPAHPDFGILHSWGGGVPGHFFGEKFALEADVDPQPELGFDEAQDHRRKARPAEQRLHLSEAHLSDGAVVDTVQQVPLQHQARALGRPPMAHTPHDQRPVEFDKIEPHRTELPRHLGGLLLLCLVRLLVLHGRGRVLPLLLLVRLVVLSGHRLELIGARLLDLHTLLLRRLRLLLPRGRHRLQLIPLLILLHLLLLLLGRRRGGPDALVVLHLHRGGRCETTQQFRGRRGAGF